MSISIRPYRAEHAMAVREVHLRAFEDRREEALLDLHHRSCKGAKESNVGHSSSGMG